MSVTLDSARRLIEANRCTAACLGATADEGACTCGCGGRYHGTLWDSLRRGGALDFGVDEANAKSAERHGRHFWLVGLPDGREAQVTADGMEVVDGALTLWTESFYKGDPDNMERVEKPRSNLLALAAGQWVHCYSASVFSGDPVAINYLPAP